MYGRRGFSLNPPKANRTSPVIPIRPSTGGGKREGEREGRRKEKKEGGREGRREEEKEGRSEGGRKGGRERGREGEREGGRDEAIYPILLATHEFSILLKIACDQNTSHYQCSIQKDIIERGKGGLLCKIISHVIKSPNACASYTYVLRRNHYCTSFTDVKRRGIRNIAT